MTQKVQGIGASAGIAIGKAFVLPTWEWDVHAQPYILVAKELSPSQLVHLNPKNVLGIVMLQGGKTSHSAIMARALGIPLVLGLEGKISKPIQTGDTVIVDGEYGIVHIAPPQDVISCYEVRRDAYVQEADELQKIVSLPAVTLDDFNVQLGANISSTRELNIADQNGAEGVGLFRTEFMYMDRSYPPSEAEQFTVYLEAAEHCKEKSVIIRTLDVGGDKPMDYLNLPEEDNPFLGYRAIRICLDRQDLFKTQLRAILRASAHGPIMVMFPMITSVNEVQAAKSILEDAKAELREEGLPFNEELPVGIMIEVPAAAMIADQLAKEVDFFSIGTNDLVQYTLAVDRMNEQIAHMYDPFHPAVLRLIRYTVQAAKQAGIMVGVCGEMAGDPRAVPIWLALGVNKLSMSSRSIPRVKAAVRRSTVEQCKRIAQSVFESGTKEEIEILLEQQRS
ncbi:phosphoenolpyruvate--protein phosphotransferase [Paenibacillus alvei]|uniref:phosphoenolpyruvate--protein phosphotransferase n=1 Tax=Paenibacillus alvei TaxID=44250 RepID=A0ABT4GUV1_PAEAL|nr:phosphoenolpyruvate--protein phosphotransferase [Paenibacillus alvei]MCY9760470.1 phosphoenolpyruvate--protein phosphotransferase [Paenibacillus alvei]MCY9767762.1 phosphoenolpyruvate--protein phosphotransferase [Paenibacillus alvei]